MKAINELSRHINPLSSVIEQVFSRVIANGWFVLGPAVNTFEKEFAAYCGTEHCVTLANGTDALELGLRSLGVQRGDKVATVANAGFYTSTAALALGAEPLYMDVDLVTHVVTLSEVNRAINEGARAIVVTHLYGQAVLDIAEIAENCSAAGVALVEDCAQAHGAKVGNKLVGCFGDIGCFSFYPTKNLGALGDGGAVVCKDVALAKKLRQLRQYGWSAKYQVELAGACNSRLDEIQAAILTEFLPYLDGWNARRRGIATQYSTLIIHPEIYLPPVSGEDYVAHLYVIRSPHRDALREHLSNRKIASDIHYPIPDYRQPVFGGLYTNIHLANTEQLAQEILTLPCYPEMTHDDVNIVIDAVNTFQAR